LLLRILHDAAAGTAFWLRYVDANDNCIFEANETPIAGVRVELLDAAGNVIATTFTRRERLYQFSICSRAFYTVRTQPQNQAPLNQFLDGCDTPGPPGAISGPNRVVGRAPRHDHGITLQAGDQTAASTTSANCPNPPLRNSVVVFCDDIRNGRLDLGSMSSPTSASGSRVVI